MAGIGFELRRVFQQQTMAGRVRGYSYALLIAAGPMLVSITLLLCLHVIMRLSSVSAAEREQVSALITWSFIFAMIISSGPAIAITRFIADRIYISSQKGIHASVTGSLALICLLSLPTSLLLYARLDLPLISRFLSCQLLIELAVIYLLMSYISAVRKYRAVGAAFAGAGLIVVVTAPILLAIGLQANVSVPLALVSGYGFCLLRLLIIVRNSFEPDTSSVFVFWRCLVRMPRLVISNTVYALALFSHNFIIWLGDDKTLRLSGGLYFAPAYDIACFLAVLTVLPASVRFLVQAETGFHDKFTSYTAVISKDGTMQNIIDKRNQMSEYLWKQLAELFKSQAIFSILAALLGSRIVLPLLKLGSQTLELFPIMCLSFLLIWMVFIMVTFILYFDQQSVALRIMLMLWILTSGLTWLLLPAGETYHGIGLLVGAVLTTVYALFRLRWVLLNVDYLIYTAREVSM